MNGGAGFGVDGEKRLRLPGADSTRAKSEGHGIHLSVGAQIVEFPAVSCASAGIALPGGISENVPRSHARNRCRGRAPAYRSRLFRIHWTGKPATCRPERRPLRIRRTASSGEESPSGCGPYRWQKHPMEKCW